jgi:hypothetical protein
MYSQIGHIIIIIYQASRVKNTCSWACNISCPISWLHDGTPRSTCPSILDTMYSLLLVESKISWGGGDKLEIGHANLANHHLKKP